MKLIYWFQISALVQAVLFLISGTITDITGQWYKIQWLMLLLAFLRFPIMEGIQSYYERILKKELKETKKQIIWKPFDRGNDRYYETVNPSSIETNYYSFQEIQMRVADVCHQKNYLLWKKYLSDSLGEVHLYLKEDNHWLQIFMVIDTQKKEPMMYNIDNIRTVKDAEYAPDMLEALIRRGGTKEHIDSLLKDFFQGYFGNLNPDKEIFLTALICTESMSTYWSIVNSAVRQSPGRYWLPAILTFDTGVLYIGKQKKKYGSEQYEKIKNELLEMLNLNLFQS